MTPWNQSLILVSMILWALFISCSKSDNNLANRTEFNFNQFKESFDTDCCGYTGGDGVYSIELNANKSIFIFGDTYLGTVNEDNSRDNGTPAVKNSIAIWENNRLTTKHGGTPDEPKPFFETRDADSSWYWPGHGVLFSDQVVCFLSEFEKSGKGVFGFEWKGTSIAMFDTIFYQPKITEWGHGTDIHFGSATFKENDNLYVFGIKAFRMYIARANVNDLNSWTYFDSSSWVPVPGSSMPVDSVFVSEQFSFFKQNEKYIIISQGALLGQDIFSYTSDAITHSWSGSNKIYETKEKASDSTLFTYNALAHPQFSNGDSLLISYCLNSTDFISIYKNVDRYRPKFINLPFEKILRGKTGVSSSPDQN